MTTKFCSFLCNKTTAFGDPQQFLLVISQSKNTFLLFSCYSSFQTCSYEQHKIFKLTTRMFAFNIQGDQEEKTLQSS